RPSRDGEPHYGSPGHRRPLAGVRIDAPASARLVCPTIRPSSDTLPETPSNRTPAVLRASFVLRRAPHGGRADRSVRRDHSQLRGADPRRVLLRRAAGRGRGPAARRRALALPLAALALTLAAGRSGAWPEAGPGSLAGAALSDSPEWWRDVGRPGAWPGASAGDGYPWTLAGLAFGAWSIAEPLTGEEVLAFPGVPSAREPLAWFDSLQVSAGEGAAWRCFGAPLVVGAPGPQQVDTHRTRAVFHFLNGDFGMDETGLMVERGDSLG